MQSPFLQIHSVSYAIISIFEDIKSLVSPIYNF